MSIAQPDLTGLWESRLQKMELGKVLFCAYFCDVYFLCDKTQLNRMLLITCLNGWFFLSTDRKTRTHSWLTFANSQGTCRIHRSARSYFLLLLRLSCIYISIFLNAFLALFVYLFVMKHLLLMVKFICLLFFCRELVEEAIKASGTIEAPAHEDIVIGPCPVQKKSYTL